MAGYRKVKHVYDDNWEDRNQFKTSVDVDWDEDDYPDYPDDLEQEEE